MGALSPTTAKAAAGAASAAKANGVSSASKSAASAKSAGPPKRVTPKVETKTKSTGAVAKAASTASKAAPDVSNIFSSSTPAKRVVQTVPVKGKTVAPGADESRSEQRAARPPGGLNSDKFYQRVADNGGVVPFEGPVDWAGIYDYLQAPADRRMAREAAPIEITIPGKGTPTYDKVSDQPLSWGNMLDFAGTPEVSSRYLSPAPAPKSGTTYYPPDGDYGYNAVTGEYEIRRAGEPYDNNPMTAQERQALAMIGGVENPALGGIDTATAGDWSKLPADQRWGWQSPFAGMGSTIRMAVGDDPYMPQAPVDLGIDSAMAPEEPSQWDTVVDNTGKLLSHTGLGGIVSSLFPDMWNGMGDAFKGIGGVKTKYPEDMAVAMDDIYGEKSQRRREKKARENQPRPFPDLNHNGVDDRTEGYTGPDTGQPPRSEDIPLPVWDLPPTRTARFPSMPPYNPGRSDEWTYFTNNHLADGGLVHAYAEGGDVGGSFDPSDPKVQLIGATEDVLEKLAGGAKPDAQDAKILKAFVAQFGDGALKALHDNVGEGMSMKSGRLIKGPGGPKDDAVPAVIVEEGSVVSPAKLSNGEFVFSVEAVEGAGGPEALQELADRLSARKSAA